MTNRCVSSPETELWVRPGGEPAARRLPANVIDGWLPYPWVRGRASRLFIVPLLEQTEDISVSTFR